MNAYLVALGAGLATATSVGGAVTGDVAGLAAAVAGLGVLGTLGAVTAWRNVSAQFKRGQKNRRLTHVALA